MAITTVRSRGLLLAIAAFVFWAISVSLLRYAYPVYFDGGGPMPSFFYWGRLPDLAEYNQHHWQYDVRFLLPYCLAALVLTFACLFIAPKLSRRLTPRNSVGLYGLASLLLVFAVAAVSDVMLRSGLFYGSGAASYVRLLIVGLPLAVSSAVIASLIEKRPTRMQD